MVGVRSAPGGRRVVRARVHDRKSPSLPFEWRRVAVEWTAASGAREAPMQWYGEYLWRAVWPEGVPPSTPYRVCATDAAAIGPAPTARDEPARARAWRLQGLTPQIT